MWIKCRTLGLGTVAVSIAMMLIAPLSVRAAELPAHDPMRILVISDEVNPHGLSPSELTEPGDIAAALVAEGSGLNLDTTVGPAVVEVNSQCIDDALGRLQSPGSVDAVIYFAHLAALGCDGSAQQEPLTAALEQHLYDGGGVILFHHGVFEASGKEPVLRLLGASAGSISWNTAIGQDVIATAPDHFVASQGLSYSGERPFEGVGVTAGQYPFFNNNPDERYGPLTMFTEPGDERTVLFTSADPGGESPRVLGYDLRRAGWGGHVVFYQPGEYQPHALDDRSGNNFQILANALVYVASTMDEPTATGSGTEPATGGPGGDESTDDGPVTGDGSGAADTSGGPSSDPSTSTDSGAGSMTSSGTVTGFEASVGGDGGCGCRSHSPLGGSGAFGLLLMTGLGAIGRRRRSGGRVDPS